MATSPESAPGGLDDLTVEELQGLIRAGHGAAAEDALWRRLEPELRTAAAAKARGAPREMNRAHLVNEALGEVRLVLRQSAIDAIRIESYMKVAIRWRVADLVRRHLVISGHELRVDDVDDPIMRTPDPTPSPEQRLIDAEDEVEKGQLARLLLEAIEIVEVESKFGPRQMTAVRLQFFESLPVNEIALRLKMSKKTAENALQDGKAALGTVLRERFGVGGGTLTPQDEDDE